MSKVSKMSTDTVEDPSSAKLKFIGSLDLILVVSLVTFVVFTIIIPISPYSNGHPHNIDEGSTSSSSSILYYGNRNVGGGGVEKPGGVVGGKPPPLKITTPFVFFSFLALLVVFGLLGILSSMVLIKAASLEDIDKTEKTNMVAFALHGILASSFILGICVWYIIAAWVEPLEHSSNLVMTTSLILFLFSLIVRLTFALIIWKERKNISGEDHRVLDLETLRERCGAAQRYQQDYHQQSGGGGGGGGSGGNNGAYKDWLEGRKFMTTSFRDKWQNPVINLGPYRGSGFGGVPQCHCASSQGCCPD